MVPDASHATEEDYLPEWHVRELYRSQGGALLLLTTPDIDVKNSATVHLVSFSIVYAARLCEPKRISCSSVLKRQIC